MLGRVLLGTAGACLLLGLLPAPSQASPQTRTSPYDFGLQCVSDDSSGAVGPVGGATGYSCRSLPDPVAYTGTLRAGEVVFVGAAAVVEGGFDSYGGVGHSDQGRRWSATGVNINTAGGGVLQASARVSGATGPVCLSVVYSAPPNQVQAQDCGPALSVRLNVPPNGAYSIEVTLFDGSGQTVSAPSPCPPGTVVSCLLKGSVRTSQSSAQVDAITWSIG